MTKYIFHGGCVQPESISNNAFYAEFVKDVPGGGMVLLVYFASRTDDVSARIAYDIEQCQKFSIGKSIKFEVASLDNFMESAASADAIFFRGGSTEKLLNTLSQFPDLKSVFENKDKTVAGSSAGAYVLSTLYSSHYEDKAEPGLGIVPVRVVTHYQSEKMPPMIGAVEALKKAANNLPLIILKEGDWEAVII